MSYYQYFFFLFPDATVWPDPSLGLLGPKDLRMPLPGNVGFSRLLVPETGKQAHIDKDNTLKPNLEALAGIYNYERQVQVLKQSTQEDMDYLYAQEIEELLMDFPRPSDVLECVAQECPKLVRKGISFLYVIN